MPSVVRGGLLGTITEKVCSADRPWGSLAVTVTVALPRATPITLALLPSPEALATPELEVSTVYCRVSPSGSLKYPERSTVSVSLDCNTRSGMDPSPTGERLGTTTEKLCSTDSSSVSRAVTTTVAVSREIPTTIRVSSEMPTVAIPASDTLAS